MKSILDPTFRYHTALNTDLHKTFARIRRAQRDDARRATLPTPATSANVSSIVRKIATGR